MPSGARPPRGSASPLAGDLDSGPPTHREGRRAKLGGDHPESLEALNDLAGVQLLQGRYIAAEELYAEALAERRRVLGDDHPDTLLTLNDLAYLFLLQGRYGDSEPLYLEALEGCIAVRGLDWGQYRPMPRLRPIALL